MIETIIAALLPIIITLILGYFAGWHHDFNATQGSTLNRMVMLYALPLSLFSGMVSMNKSLILAQGSMALLLLIGMVGGYLVVLAIARYIFRCNIKVAALQALAIAGPAVPFVGVPVLGYLYGDLSTVPIAICSLIMNLIQVPITLFILSQDDQNKGKASSAILTNLKDTIKEPVVWAPILAFILLLIDIQVPETFRSSLKLLGESTGGVALFASGVMLFSYSITFNKGILLTVFSKNVLFPLIMLLVGCLFGISGNSLDISIITLSIPSASVCVIFAVQYKVAAKEMASVLFFSTILSIITMGGFLLYLH